MKYKPKNILPTIFLLCLACTVFTAKNAHANKLKVVASFSVLADLVKEVGGTRIEISTLVPANQVVHNFEPTAEQITKMSNADLVVVNGIGYERWLGRLVVTSGYSGPIVVAAKGVTVLNVNEKLDQDPHAWHVASNAKRYVENIRDALVNADRRNSSKYKDNATNYMRDLDALEYWIKNQFRQIPDHQQVFVMGNNALQYFGRYYGIQILSPTDAGTHSATSANVMASIITQMKQAHIRAVFYENTGDNAIANQFLQEFHLAKAGTLYTESLSGPGGEASTYIEMMRYNVKKMVTGMYKNGEAFSPENRIKPEKNSSETLYYSVP